VFLNWGDAIIEDRYFSISSPNLGDVASSLIDNDWAEAEKHTGNIIATMTINGGTFETKENSKYLKNDSFGRMVINGGIYNLLNDSVAITTGGTLNFTAKKYKPIGASDDTTVSANEKEIKDILDVKEIDSSTISKEDNKLFKKAMKDKYKVAGFYDINLFKGINDDLKFEEVLETSDKVKITLSIPTTISKVEAGYKRTYYVIRLHNGKTDILDVTLTDDDKVSFETDKFSSYALVYTDEKIGNTTQLENPNTSDKALIYEVISLIGLSGIIYTARVLKKRA